MSLVRISTSGPKQTYILQDLFTQRGLHTVVLSPTEIGIECAELPEDLGSMMDLCSSSIAEQDIHQASAAPAPTDPPGSDIEFKNPDPGLYWNLESSAAEAEQEYSPEREFIFAPHWRAAKAAMMGLLSAIEIKNRHMQQWLDARVLRLHEAEERILQSTRSKEAVREAAEAKVWEASAQPGWSLGALTNRGSGNGKYFAAAGGLVMAALFGLGMLLSHKSPSSSAPLQTQTEETASAPRSNLALVAKPHSARPLQTAQRKKTAPVHVQMAANRSASHVPAAVRSHPASGNHASRDYDNGPEVVTHYYHQAQTPQVRKTSYQGIKYYSDLN